MFYIVGLTDILIFAVPLYFAYRRRLDPPAHKRFIYIATITLLTPAIARLPFAFVYRKPPVVALLAEGFVLILVGYELWSTHRIHRATLWAGSFLELVLQTRFPIGKTAAWPRIRRLGGAPGSVRVPPVRSFRLNREVRYTRHPRRLGVQCRRFWKCWAGQYDSELASASIFA